MSLIKILFFFFLKDTICSLWYTLRKKSGKMKVIDKRAQRLHSRDGLGRGCSSTSKHEWQIQHTLTWHQYFIKIISLIVLPINIPCYKKIISNPGNVILKTSLFVQFYCNTWKKRKDMPNKSKYTIHCGLRSYPHFRGYEGWWFGFYTVLD